MVVKLWAKASLAVNTGSAKNGCYSDDMLVADLHEEFHGSFSAKLTLSKAFANF